ncbi:snRNA-activating protein complex subunit 3 [Phytophthora citrophthora]|uniref:snRNA-activating protein complex subunit 3 n=1 Tax=Phytophthora citrophthora TaxID=4793 RepID=A0AAD9GGU0_9STRA|nr:snRNA-activating protein complex subunit 3 [Phytophthora citrophthora]
MDFQALFPPLMPADDAIKVELSSIDISVDDILLPPLEKAVDDGIYRALRRWNEGDSALTDKALPYTERIKKYQRIATLALQPDSALDVLEDEDDDETTESEEEQPEETSRAAIVAKEKAATAAVRQKRKERKKLQREIEAERVRFEAVFEELDDIDELRAQRVPSERLQNFVDTFKIKKRRLVQKRSMANTVTSMSFEFARPVPDANDTKAEKVKEDGKPVQDNDAVLWFDVLHPSKDPARTQSFLVRRSQRISELVDLFACANDERLGEHAKSSKLVYFGQKFFVDRRVPGTLDYSKQIRRWIRAKPERQAKFGAAIGGDRPRSLHSATFADLELHVDVPGVYIHQGECEHLLRLRDARLPHELDAPKSSGIFPLRLPNPLNHPLRNCLICQHYSAKYVCYGDRLAVVDPMFFCNRCYRAAHYNSNGKLLYDDFLSFSFVQD